MKSNKFLIIATVFLFVTVSLQAQDSITNIGAAEVSTSRTQTGFSNFSNSVTQRFSTTLSGIESLLKVLPGVQSGNEFSSQYSVRGGSFDENLVYINGIELYRPLLIRNAQQEGLSIVNAQLTERIEFSTGGFGVEFGDKLSSVLNIHYKEPQKNTAIVEVNFLGAQIAADFCSADRKFSSTTGVRYRNNNYLLNTLQERGSYSPNYIDLQNNINLQLTPYLKLNLVTILSFNNYYFQPTDRETSFGTVNRPITFRVYFEGDEKDNYTQWLQGVRLLWKPLSDWSIESTVAVQGIYEKERYDILSQYFFKDADGMTTKPGITETNYAVGGLYDYARNQLNTHIYSADVNAIWQHHKYGSLKIGAKVQVHTVQDQNQSYRYLDSAGFFIPPPSPTELTVDYYRSGQHQFLSQSYTLFAEERYYHQFSNLSIRFNGGLRFTYTPNNNEFLISPRLSLLFFPHQYKQLQYYISGGMYQQPPFYKELRYDNGNINQRLRSQKSTHAIVGVSYSLNNVHIPLRLSAEGYYKYLWDLVPYSQENVRLTYAAENITKGYIYGIDMKLNALLVESGESWISLSLMQARQKMTDNTSGYFPMTNDQLLSASAYIADEIPYFSRLQFQMLLSYGTGLPTHVSYESGYDKTFRSPGYKRIDIGLSYIFFDASRPVKWIKYIESLKISVDVLNLFKFDNVASYTWLRTLSQIDIQGSQYAAVPNYLTGRRINFNITCKF